MPSPSSYGTSVTNVDPGSLGVGRYVADGEKWGGSLGSGVTLTYSFPGNGSIGYFANFSDPYPAGAGFGYGEWNGWFRLSAPEMAAVRSALATWQNFANVTFLEVDDGQLSVGELRFASSNQLPGTSRHTLIFRIKRAQAATFGSTLSTNSTPTAVRFRSVLLTIRPSCTK